MQDSFCNERKTKNGEKMLDISSKYGIIQKLSDGMVKYGGIAQLGEHLLCKQGVSGSIPLISTKGRDA